jgi:hypothetical protein
MLKLASTVALGRMKDVASQALRMYADKSRNIRIEFAFDKGDELLAGVLLSERYDAKAPEFGREVCFSYTFDLRSDVDWLLTIAGHMTRLYQSRLSRL